jgi:excisionase family DNA binding protein
MEVSQDKKTALVRFLLAALDCGGNDVPPPHKEGLSLASDLSTVFQRVDNHTQASREPAPIPAEEAHLNLITTKQAASLLGIDETNVRRYCRMGQIKATKLGHIWMIDREEIKRFAQVPRRRGRKKKENGNDRVLSTYYL